MTLKQNFELMGKYNQWMNEQVFDAPLPRFAPKQVWERKGILVVYND